MKKVFLFCLIGGLLFIGGRVAVLATMSSDNYTIFADVFATGGDANSTSTNYLLRDTLGETIILSATSTSVSYGIKAGFQELYPDHFLTLSVGDTAIDLGTLSNLTTKSASHTLLLDSNAVNGFTVTVSGATLTQGSDTIDAIGSTATAAVVDTEQFGINLAANSSPNVGADPSGTSPLASVASTYGTADSFAYSSGATIASASTDINETTFTVSYIANISSSTVFGGYSTTLTYAATVNF